MPSMTGLEIFATPLGPMGAAWSGEAGSCRVERIFLPGEDLEKAAGRDRFKKEATPCPVAELVRSIQQYLQGAEAAFDPDLLHLEQCTPFREAVLRAQYSVARGRVCTYGELAAAAGRPGGARAAGGALAANPFPVVIPCHRTVRSDGTLGGFGGGRAMKAQLLGLEGVSVSPDGKIDVWRFRFDFQDTKP